MPRRRTTFPAIPAILLVLLGMAGCAPVLGGGPGGPGGLSADDPPFSGAHAVVVIFDGAPDTLAFDLVPEWRRIGSGADSVWAFARADAPANWTAFGRIEGDSLVWGLTRMAGDMGVTLELRGPVGRDGGSGCGGYVRRGYTSPETDTTAAWVLVPDDRDPPRIADAPVARCGG